MKKTEVVCVKFSSVKNRVVIFLTQWKMLGNTEKYWELLGNTGNTGKNKSLYYEMLEVDQIRYCTKTHLDRSQLYQNGT